MLPINPSISNFNRLSVPSLHPPGSKSVSSLSGALRVAQSVQKALSGNIALASPTSLNSAGIYNKFQQDNGNGVMIRIGASGSGEQYTFSAPNTGIVINHGLGRQPSGFHVADLDGVGTIYRTTAPDANQITLACTVDTVNATVYIW